MVVLIHVDEVVEWLRRYSGSFVNARKLSRKFNVNSKVAAHLLKQLNDRGYINLYRRRRGRFNIYKINRNRLNNETLSPGITVGAVKSE
ncbi:MAG: hypothetical protein QW772_05310 [Zestosphaera sp.]